MRGQVYKSKTRRFKAPRFKASGLWRGHGHGSVRLLLASLLLCWASQGWALDITVVGLFKNMAVVRIDDHQRVLRVGQTSPEGVKLVKADSEAAVLDVNGKRERYRLGNRVSTRFSQPPHATARIWQGAGGMYHGTGAINGQTVDFMVDTGATWVSMNAHEARRLGIDFRYRGEPGRVSTANGVVRVYTITLDSVQVGDITVKNVKAAVLEGDSPPVVLLGMSFLNRVNLRREGTMLEMEKKW